MDNRECICKLANDVQDALLMFIRKVNELDIDCLSRDIEEDSNMLLFHSERTWRKFIDVFDILGFDYTTGEADDMFNTWYINFEFSEGILPTIGF